MLKVVSGLRGYEVFVGDEESILMGNYREVAREVAEWVRPVLGNRPVVEFNSAAGGTTIGMAETGISVFAVDLNPLRLQALRVNAGIYGVSSRIGTVRMDMLDRGDWTRLHNEVSNCGAVFADPDWAPEDSSSKDDWTPDPDRFQPPLSLIQKRVREFFGNVPLVVRLPKVVDPDLFEGPKFRVYKPDGRFSFYYAAFNARLSDVDYVIGQKVQTVV